MKKVPVTIEISVSLDSLLDALGKVVRELEPNELCKYDADTLEILASEIRKKLGDRVT